MSKRRFGWMACGMAALALAGCRVSSLSIGYHEDYYHRPVHVCGYECDHHYWNGSRVVVLSDGHHHGPECGHYWDGRYWVAGSHRSVARVHVEPQKVRVTHVHGSDCGCAYHPHEQRWVILKRGHVHGPGCGHVYVKGRWTVRF